MNTPLAEDEVRGRLHSALDVLAPAPQSVDELRRAVAARRRLRLTAVAVAAVVATGVGVGVGFVVTSGTGAASRDRLLVPAVPQPTVDPAQALHGYVVSHKATSPVGPLTGADAGTYAADIESGHVHVLSFDGTTWNSVAQLGSPMKGVPVVAVRPGPDGTQGPVAFQVDIAGGDAVFNGIVVGSGGGWQYADFDCGTTDIACAAGGHRATKWAIDGTEVDHTFHSEPNDCTPNCAAGTRYDVTWRWDSTYGVFVVDSAVKTH